MAVEKSLEVFIAMLPEVSVTKGLLAISGLTCWHSAWVDPCISSVAIMSSLPLSCMSLPHAYTFASSQPQNYMSFP